jgi:hypothetical protein
MKFLKNHIFESKTKYKNKKKYAINFELIPFGFSIFPFGAYMMNGYSRNVYCTIN